MKHKILTALLIILTIMNIGWLFQEISESRTESIKSNQYPLLSRRIFAENPNDVLVSFVPLRAAVKQYLANTGLENSFYFEYLPSGVIIRSDENNQLAGASLLKLPTVVSLYKGVEMGKVDLNKEVVIKQEWLDNRFGDLWKKGAGTKITLAEAVRLALVDSDDTAIKTIRGTLAGLVDSNESILSQLDIEFPYTPDDQQSQVSAQDYAAVLKCLYLACFLTPAHSQAILDQLVQAPDFNRIAKPIPKSVKVAHKIGVFGNEVQSDCGVVYVPRRPYVICIMLKAPAAEAEPNIQTISKLIYDYISDPSR